MTLPTDGQPVVKLGELIMCKARRGVERGAAERSGLAALPRDMCLGPSLRRGPRRRQQVLAAAAASASALANGIRSGGGGGAPALFFPWRGGAERSAQTAGAGGSSELQPPCNCYYTLHK